MTTPTTNRYLTVGHLYMATELSVGKHNYPEGSILYLVSIAPSTHPLQKYHNVFTFLGPDGKLVFYVSHHTQLIPSAFALRALQP